MSNVIAVKFPWFGESSTQPSDSSELKPASLIETLEAAIRDGFDVIWIHELTIKGDNSDVKSTGN